MQLHCTPPACSLGSKRRRRRRIRRSYLRRHRTELELRSFYCAHRLRSLASTLGRTASCISRTALHHAARLAALLKCIGDSDRRHGCAPINRVAPVYSTTGHMTYPQAVHVRCTRWPNITLATRSAWAGRAGAGPDGTSRSIGRPRGTIGRREAGKFERARPGVKKLERNIIGHCVGRLILSSTRGTLRSQAITTSCSSSGRAYGHLNCAHFTRCIGIRIPARHKSPGPARAALTGYGGQFCMNLIVMTPACSMSSYLPLRHRAAGAPAERPSALPCPQNGTIG